MLPVEAFIIERMHRLSVFQHDIVRDIDNIVNRTHAGCAQSHAQPKRRGRNFHVFDHARAVTEAFFRILNRNIDIIFDIVARFLYRRHRNMQRPLEACRALACQPDDGKTVGTVRRDFKFDGAVAHFEHIDDIVARLAAEMIVIQNQNAVGCGARHIVRREPKLLNRAEHALGNKTAQLAGLDFHARGKLCHALFIFRTIADGHERPLKHVFRRGDDLQCLFSAVHLADDETLRVRMLLDLPNEPHLYILDFRAEKLISLHLGAGVGHSVAVFFDFNIFTVHKIGQPFHR